MRDYEIDGFKRITKVAARKAYKSGAAVYMCPVNLRPGAPWYPEIRAEWDANGERFETIAAGVAFYNCNASAGHYLAYYIEK